MIVFLIILGIIFLLGFIIPVIIKLFLSIKTNDNKNKNKNTETKLDSLVKVDFDINLASYIASKKGQTNCEIKNNTNLSCLELINNSSDNIVSNDTHSQFPENKILSFF